MLQLITICCYLHAPQSFLHFPRIYATQTSLSILVLAIFFIISTRSSSPLSTSVLPKSTRSIFLSAMGDLFVGQTSTGAFKIGYNSSATGSSNGETLATNFLAVADEVFTACTSEFFPGVNLLASNSRVKLPIIIIVSSNNLAPDSGARCGIAADKTLRITISSTGLNLTSNDNDRLLYLTMLEVSKVFMFVQNTGWYARSNLGDLQPQGIEFDFDISAGNIGDGLAHYCASEFVKERKLSFIEDFATPFMTAPATTTAPERDTSSIARTDLFADGTVQSSCAMLFIYYLHAQLGFSTIDIIGSGNTDLGDVTVPKLSLADVYRTLTGDAPDEDGRALFSSLLSESFPFPNSIPVRSLHDWNNPWPLVDVKFFGGQQNIDVVDVYELMDNVPGRFTNNVMILINGLTLRTEAFANLTVTCSSIPQIIFRPSTRGPPPVTFNENVPQTFVRPFDINFPSLSLFPLPGVAETTDLEAAVTFTAEMPFLPPPPVSATRSTLASTPITLSGANADPHFQNVETFPIGTNPWYLSRDLVILRATPRYNASPVQPGVNQAPSNSAPRFQTDPTTQNLEADDTRFAWQYLRDVLTFLNSYYAQGGSGFPDPLSNGVIPQDSAEFSQSASLLNPWFYWNDLSQGGLSRRARTYHFGIARVRLDNVVGANNAASTAPRTEVFFRHLSSGVDTSFNSNTTYQTSRPDSVAPFPTSTSSDGLPIFGTQVTQQQLANEGNSEFGPGGLNTHDLVKNQVTPSTWAYYGCFIDSINSQLNPVGQYPWTLVAQIDFPPASIREGASPRDQPFSKIAQRDVIHADSS